MTWPRRAGVIAVVVGIVTAYAWTRPVGPAGDRFTMSSPRTPTTTSLAVTTTTRTLGHGTTTTSPTTPTTKPRATAPTPTTRPPSMSTACSVFPADNPWNTDVSAYPVHPNSQNYVNSIGAGGHVHPDFGTFWDGGPIGIPFVHVGANQPRVAVSFDYDDESDPGPYPIPPDAPIEGGPSSDGDRHVIVIDDGDCALYELFDARKNADNSWHAGSGARFNLRSNALRPDYWTSADAAGLPIYAGLVRYEEVRAGAINHALRFTVSRTQRGFIHPATHYASSSTDANLPPMGLRFRMKASYSCASLSREAQVVCAALKRYGMFVADNGSNWYITGEHNPKWNDDALGDLKSIPGSAFEAIETGPVIR